MYKKLKENIDKGESIATIVKAQTIAQLACEKKASDIVILELTNLTILCDYFVMCTGESSPQIQAIVDHILENLSRIGIKPLCVEGHQQTRWILIDFGDVVVHVFDRDKRSYYEIEKLWLDAPRIKPELS
jgi:ribosome-associated protein